MGVIFLSEERSSQDLRFRLQFDELAAGPGATADRRALRPQRS
jgi:hypothetical protein